MTLHPVLAPVSLDARARTPEQVKAQRAAAQRALIQCAELCHAPAGGWQKNADNVPVANEGFYWSVSHKREWAVVVIADRPVGIDIEKIAPRRDKLVFDELADEQEWSLMPDRSWESFFMLWTAKEATLKANGVGIGKFATCRLERVSDERNMELFFDDNAWRVEHYCHEDHIVALTKSGASIVWHTP